jgi:GAF domain-containing protein
MVVEEARRLTDASRTALCLLNPEQEMLDFVAVAGENAEEIVGLRIRVADSLSEQAIATAQPVLLDRRTPVETGDLFASVEDNPLPPRPAPRWSTGEAPTGPRSAVVVPIFQEGRIVGTLSALNKIDPNSASFPAFDADDADTLALLAEMVSLAHTFAQTARAEREQNRELNVLYETTQSVSSSLNVQDVMENVLEAICGRLEYNSAVLFLLNDDRTHLFIASDRGLSEEELDVQLSVDLGLPARILQNGQPYLIPDTEMEPLFEDFSERAHALSALFAPIRSRDETYGLIQITSLQRNAYHEDDLKLINAVAMQAGIAIENAWLYEDAQRQAEEAKALYNISQQVNATLLMEEVLHFVADSVLALLKVDRFVAYLFDAKSEELHPSITRGLDPTLLPKAKIGEGIGGWVYEWQTPQAVADVAADRRNQTAPLHQADVASTLCVPMHIGEQCIGVLHAMSSRRRLFTVAEMELLYTIANQAAVAVENARLYQQTRERSQERLRNFQWMANAIGKTLKDTDLTQLLADIAVEMLGGKRFVVYARRGDSLQLITTNSLKSVQSPDTEIAVGVGLAGWVARRGQRLIVEDLASDTRTSAHSWLQREGVASYLGIPLKLGRQTVGVIEIYSEKPRLFTQEEGQLLSNFARRTRLLERIAVLPAEREWE